MKYLIILLTLCISFSSIKAQDLKLNIDATSMGKANTGINQTSPFSVFNNQATLAYIDHLSVGIAVKNDFLTKELNTSILSAAIPTKYGVFGLGMSYYGFELFNQKKIGIAYALPLGEKFAVGIKLDFFHQQLDTYYGSASSIIGEIGFTSKPTERIKIGAHIFNPTKATLNSENSDLIPIYETIGISYLFSENLEIMAEQFTDFEYNFFKFGGEYCIKNSILLRSGYTTQNNSVSFGGGVKLKHFSTNVAFSYSASNIVYSNSLSSSIDLFYQF